MCEIINEEIEDVILRYSNRGMTKIKKYISTNYCKKAAEEILSWNQGTIFLATGFYVAGFAETDGPVGTLALAIALKKLGFRPVILTDLYCKDFFKSDGVETLYIPLDCSLDAFDGLLEKYKPVGIIAIERCGKNQYGEYANMRGVSISEHTAPIDELFLKCFRKIPSIGVGDGGNEIGMGKLAKEIAADLSIEPCVVSTDILVLATVSNWGAYGIICALSILSEKKLLPSYEWIENYLELTVGMGSVDGVTKQHTISVDGKGMEIEKEIITSLREIEKDISN